MIPRLEGDELRQYQEHEKTYMEYKAAKWDPNVPLSLAYGQDRPSYLEKQAQAAWKVCAKILLQHGVSKKQIKVIKNQAKDRSREQFSREMNDPKKNAQSSHYTSYSWEE